MSRLYNTFEFIGELQIPSSKERFHDVKTSQSGWEGHRLNFGVQETKTNSVFVELYGGFSKAKQNKVYSFGKGTESNKGTKLEIPWEDRLNEETVDMVADFKKYVVDFTTDKEVKSEVDQLLYQIRLLEYKDERTQEEIEKLVELKNTLKEKAKDRHEFIHEYDVVKFLSDNLAAYKSHKFKLVGGVEYNAHNGRFYRKFKPTSIEIVPSDTPNKLRASFDIFFTKDSLDESDFKKEKKYHVNGYVLGYDGKQKKDVFYPQQFVLNAQKIDFENETHVKRLEFLKNKFNTKGKGVYHLQWQVNIFRGADQVEFTEKDLTASQKEAVEFGLNKLEDFAPKGGMLGESVEENRLIKPVLQKVNEYNDFSEGAVESSYELEDLEYAFTQQDSEPKEDLIVDEIEAIEKEEIELDDLFS